MAKKPTAEVVEAQESSEVVLVTISEDEYQRRIKLDVSDPFYINPSYDR